MRLLGTAFAGALLFSLEPAQAADAASRACVEAHAEGQVQREAGRLLAARAAFLACSDEKCPLVVRKECVDFSARSTTEVPSIVLAATDEQNRDLPVAGVRIDAGAQRGDQPGRATELDPGQHQVELVLADGRSQTQSFTLHVGEKLRRITLEFPSQQRPSAWTSGEPRRSAPTATYVAGGVALAALASFAALAIYGKAQEHELDRCKPSCTRSAVSRMRLAYLAADLSLGVSLASLGVGAYVLLNGSEAAPPDKARQVSGAGISVRGRF